MEDPPSNSTSNYRHLFSQKPLHVGNIKSISSIMSIWGYDRIDRLENNQWKCLWWNVKFQGFNATKALDHVIGTKCMHINRSIDSIDQAHLSVHKYLNLIKAATKVLLNDFCKK